MNVLYFGKVFINGFGEGINDVVGQVGMAGQKVGLCNRLDGICGISGADGSSHRESIAFFILGALVYAVTGLAIETAIDHIDLSSRFNRLRVP